MIKCTSGRCKLVREKLWNDQTNYSIEYMNNDDIEV